MSNNSITRWLKELNGNGEHAAGLLWEEYFERLLSVARSKIPRRNGVFDEEDVALSAFAGFCWAAQQGRYESVDGRDQLWRLLSVITARKAIQRMKYELAAKRGGGAVRTASSEVLDQQLGHAKDPAFCCGVVDEFSRLFRKLADRELQTLAGWKLGGLTDDEAAIRMGCSRRTVQRMLRVIRSVWSNELNGDDDGPQ